jgi:hypothetical protein
METVNRQEQKFYIKKQDIPLIKSFLQSSLLIDPNSKKDGYKISSLYFDTIGSDDLNQKLDGIIYREKYRIRIYDDDINSAKFEVKRKLNQCIQKLSCKLSIEDVYSMQNCNFSILDQFNDLEYVAHRMQYLNYFPSNIITYNRFAYFLPINNIRITIDADLRTHGFDSDLSNLRNVKNDMVQKNSLDILEIKFEETLPDYIINFLSSFKAVRSSISKYSLSRIHSNTEIQGDDPVIPF